MKANKLSTINMFPDWMRNSRDLRVFTTLLDLMANDVILQISQLEQAFDPDFAMEDKMSLIEKIVNVPDNLSKALTIDQKRIVLKFFNLMYRFRGSINGIIWAIKLYNLATNDNNLEPLDYKVDFKLESKELSKITATPIYQSDLLFLLLSEVMPADYMISIGA